MDFITALSDFSELLLEAESKPENSGRIPYVKRLKPNLLQWTREGMKHASFYEEILMPLDLLTLMQFCARTMVAFTMRNNLLAMLATVKSPDGQSGLEVQIQQMRRMGIAQSAMIEHTIADLKNTVYYDGGKLQTDWTYMRNEDLTTGYQGFYAGSSFTATLMTLQHELHVGTLVPMPPAFDIGQISLTSDLSDRIAFIMAIRLFFDSLDLCIDQVLVPQEMNYYQKLNSVATLGRQHLMVSEHDTILEVFRDLREIFEDRLLPAEELVGLVSKSVSDWERTVIQGQSAATEIRAS